MSRAGVPDNSTAETGGTMTYFRHFMHAAVRPAQLRSICRGVPPTEQATRIIGLGIMKGRVSARSVARTADTGLDAAPGGSWSRVIQVNDIDPVGRGGDGRATLADAAIVRQRGVKASG